ncbi:hypothetical protein V492_08265, partial [Pseudogymnoascus sp. VKM F-4246]
MSPVTILVFADSIPPTNFHNFIYSLGAVPAAQTHLRLSRGREYVWVYGPESETAGGRP